MIVGVYRVFSTVTTHCNSTTGVWNGPFVRVSRSQSHFELKFYSDPFSPLCNYNLICPYSKLFLYSCSQFREVPVSSDSVQPWLSVQKCSCQPEPTVHVRCGPGVAFVALPTSEHHLNQVFSYDREGACEEVETGTRVVLDEIPRVSQPDLRGSFQGLTAPL